MKSIEEYEELQEDIDEIEPRIYKTNINFCEKYPDGTGRQDRSLKEAELFLKTLFEEIDKLNAFFAETLLELIKDFVDIQKTVLIKQKQLIKMSRQHYLTERIECFEVHGKIRHA